MSEPRPDVYTFGDNPSARLTALGAEAGLTVEQALGEVVLSRG